MIDFNEHLKNNKGEINMSIDRERPTSRPSMREIPRENPTNSTDQDPRRRPVGREESTVDEPNERTPRREASKEDSPSGRDFSRTSTGGSEEENFVPADEKDDESRGLSQDDIERRMNDRLKDDPDAFTLRSGSGKPPRRIPEDRFELKILGFDKLLDMPNKYKKGETKDMLKWFFEIVNDPDYEGEKVGGLTAFSIHEKSITYKWLCEIYGRTITKEEQQKGLSSKELLALIGKVVEGKIVMKENGWPTVVEVMKLPSRRR